MNFHEESERTLLGVLNDGLIPFKRIIEKQDDAFTLEHRIVTKQKVVIALFDTYNEGNRYKMIIFDEIENEVLKQIEYECIENTWSVYNSLCKFINKEILAKEQDRKARLEDDKLY